MLPTPAALPPSAAGRPSGTFRNPLAPDPDPSIVHADGQYLLVATTFDRIELRRSPTLGGLLTCDPVVLWRETDPSRSADLWAPELVPLDGRWYLYYTADDSRRVDDHRLYVLESGGSDPAGPYHFKARLTDPANDGWAIDPHVLVQRDRRYLLWAGERPGGRNRLFIAPMRTPWELAAPATFLDAAGGCPDVREAPATLQRHGRVFLVYSTCDVGTPDYQLWMMSAPDGADLLDPASWTQHDGPVFRRADDRGVYGPGSNGFFRSPDGTEDWIVYHAKNTPASTYTGRTTRAQRFGWTADGTPDLGRPVAAGATQDLPSGDPGGGTSCIDDGDGEVEYSGPWRSGTDRATQCFRGDDHCSDVAGATATVRFTGRRIAVLHVRDVDTGIAGFSVDGGAEERVDTWSPVRAGEQLSWVSPLLPPGEHTLTVRVTGDRGPASTGTTVHVDRFEVLP